MVLNEGGAYTKTLLMAACSDEADGTHTIVHQFVGQCAAVHARIANGEIETIGNGLVDVRIIDDVEAMAQENLLEFLRPLAIDHHIVTEIVLTITCRSHHLRHGILSAMTRSR